MTTEIKIIVGTIITTLVIIVGGIVLLGKDNSPKPETLGQASLKIDRTNIDFGDMKVSDERSADFTITNTSDSPLRIWNISTSCDCTFASLEINGKSTPEFNMPGHMPAGLKNWIGEIAPRQKAILKATYRPKIMPVNGPITRSVYFSTNDPQNPKVEITLKANVV